MNRKLQHTIQALAASAAVFSLMLIAGGPAPVPAAAPVAVPAALLAVSAEAAGTAVEAIEAAAPQAGAEAASPGSRRHRRSHATTALPYFSFAQGLRQVAGS